MWFLLILLIHLKNRLDKFWSDQEVLYDYNADLHGIGNRSLLSYYVTSIVIRHLFLPRDASAERSYATVSRPSVRP